MEFGFLNLEESSLSDSQFSNSNYFLKEKKEKNV